MAILGGDERLIEAHGSAVAEAYAALETLACVKQGEHGVDRQRVTTGVLCSARFDHDSSRALDPHLHTHFATANFRSQRERQLAELRKVSAAEEMNRLKAFAPPRPQPVEPYRPEQAVIPDNLAEQTAELPRSVQQTGLKVDREKLLMTGKTLFRELLAADTQARDCSRVIGSRTDLTSWISIATPSEALSLHPVPSSKTIEQLDSRADQKEVSDASASQLMLDFYRYRASSPAVTKAEARRRAQVDLIYDSNARYAHPYYWAPFALIGNWQ